MKEEIRNAWLRFVKSVSTLLIPSADDRGLDQYLTFRDYVLNLVQSEDFVKLLEENLASQVTNNDPNELRIDSRVMRGLIMELSAFPRAVEVTQSTSKGDGDSKSITKTWLGKASIITGSVKDFITENKWVKNGLTVFNELIDLFKGE